MLTPDLFIKNDDMCVIFGRNKKFQHTNRLKGWNFLFLLMRFNCETLVLQLPIIYLS